MATRSVKQYGKLPAPLADLRAFVHAGELAYRASERNRLRDRAAARKPPGARPASLKCPFTDEDGALRAATDTPCRDCRSPGQPRERRRSLSDRAAPRAPALIYSRRRGGGNRGDSRRVVTFEPAAQVMDTIQGKAIQVLERRHPRRRTAHRLAPFNRMLIPRSPRSCWDSPDLTARQLSTRDDRQTRPPGGPPVLGSDPLTSRRRV